MMETNTKSPAPVASKEDVGNALMMAALDCRRQSDDDKLVLHRDPEVPGCVLRQLRDRLADAMMIAMTERAATTTSLVELREHLHGAARAGELIVLAPEAAGALVLAMSTGAPVGGAAPTNLSGLQTYDMAEIVAMFPDGTQFAKVDDVRALLAAAPVAPALMEEFGELASQLESDAQCYDGQLAEEALSCAHSMQRLIADAPAYSLTQAQIDHICGPLDGFGIGSIIDFGAAIRFQLAKIGGVK